MSEGISRSIFLIGFMGAGTRTIARALQRELGFPLIEMAERIGKEQGRSMNDIFAQYGEDHFRDIESQLIVDIGKEEPSIVSCGGGVVVRPQNTQNLNEIGRTAFLKATPEHIYERVKNSTDRPILNGHMNVEYIAELMEKRRALYEAAADITIQTDGRTREQICEEIIGKMRNTNEV